MQVIMSSPDSRALTKYVTVGVALCALVQSAYWLQLGSFRIPIADWPFLMGYSQKAMIDLLIYEASPLLQGFLWLLGYGVLSVALWAIFSRGSRKTGATWRAAVLAWTGAELALALVAWRLALAGKLTME